MFLVMGYRGNKAAAIKEAYIKKFNEMEERLHVRQEMIDDFPRLTDAISQAHNPPKFYHFSTELDMINRESIGMTAKSFRELHGISKDDGIRAHLPLEQARLIRDCQQIDWGMFEAGLSYEQRKAAIHNYCAKVKGIPATLNG